MRGILPAYSTLVPKARVKTLLIRVSNKIPPLSKTDEADLFVRLPVLSKALASTSPADIEELMSTVYGSDKKGASLLLEGLTDYVLNDQHFSDSRNAAACCVHTLIKDGFNKNLDCPAKPLVEAIADSLSASFSNVAAVKKCLDIFSLLVSDVRATMLLP